MPQYNSMNAPRWMNNTPMLMDLSCTCAPTWRSTWGNTFGYAAQVPKPLMCFQCGKEGHFAHNCPHCHFRANAAYTLAYESFEPSISDYVDLEEMLPEELQSTITCIKVELEAMSIEDKARLAQEMGGSLDFQEA